MFIIFHKFTILCTMINAKDQEVEQFSTPTSFHLSSCP